MCFYLEERLDMDGHNLIQIVNQIKEVENPLGKFIIENALGEGGTSIVKKARLDGVDSSRQYAIKFLLVDIAGHKSTEYKRFRQAYINLASVQHLGCCIPLIYFGEHENRDSERTVKIPYIVMSVADYTMEQHFTAHDKQGKRHRSASYAEFQNVFNRLGEVIQLIHDNGIIHRDIKPQNIFYYSDKLYLSDFDISKFDKRENYVEARTKKGTRLANINFSAPEQFDASIGEICNASDWFAFAQVMIWLMTGAPIVKGLAEVSLHNDDKRVRPYEILFEKLLRTNPRERLASFSEIKQYLYDNDDDVKMQEWERKEAQRRHGVKKCLHDFLTLVDFYTPQFSGCCKADLITRPDELSDLFAKLNGLMSNNAFGIVFKGGDIHNVKSFEHMGGSNWSFSGYEGLHLELSISSAIVYQHHNLGASFIVLVGQRMARVYDSNGTDYYEEFKKYQGEMLPPDVGQSARIGGSLVKINSDDVEHVIRFVEPGIYFLGPLESPICENVEKFMNLCESFSSTNELRNLLIDRKFANSIARPVWVRIYD